MSDALNPAPQKAPRTINTFDMPPNIGSVKSVGMVTLTADEELAAWKSAKGDNAALAQALAKASLVEVDGQPVKRADGSLDIAWKGLTPQERQLVLSAYAELHKVEEDDVDSFLKSRKVVVR